MFLTFQTMQAIKCNTRAPEQDKYGGLKLEKTSIRCEICAALFDDLPALKAHVRIGCFSRSGGGKRVESTQCSVATEKNYMNTKDVKVKNSCASSKKNCSPIFVEKYLFDKHTSSCGTIHVFDSSRNEQNHAVPHSIQSVSETTSALCENRKPQTLSISSVDENPHATLVFPMTSGQPISTINVQSKEKAMTSGQPISTINVQSKEKSMTSGQPISTINVQSKEKSMTSGQPISTINVQSKEKSMTSGQPISTINVQSKKKSMTSGQPKSTINVQSKEKSMTSGKPISTINVQSKEKCLDALTGFSHCHVCGIYLRTAKLEMHMDLHSSGRQFPCGECDRIFGSSRALNVHKKWHDAEKNFECEKCDKRFSSVNQIKRHIRSEHASNSTYTCVDSSTGHEIHKNPNDADNSFECGICNKKFRSSERVRRHVRLVHVPKQTYSCKECGAVFKNKYYLKSHAHVHSGAMPYVCEICGRRYRFSASIKLHLLVHKGLKPHKCWICGKQFLQNIGLKRHLTIHTGEKKPPTFTCNLCGKHLTSKNGLDYHLNIHYGRKPFRCDVCGRSFSAKGNMQTHRRTVCRQ